MRGQHVFSQIPSTNIQRSTFNRSSGVKTTLNAGDLIPVFLDEALPGDTFEMRMNTFGRMATLLSPIMDNVYMDYFFFAVPYRLVWDNFQKFMGEQDNPDDSTDYVIPTLATGSFPALSLGDYFGLPTAPTTFPDALISCLPFRAYTLIWNEWFRDQNLQDSVTVNKGNGPDGQQFMPIQKRGKRHDYFTSCLPWPQKGMAVSLPLGDNAPVLPATGQGTPLFELFTQAGGTTPPQGRLTTGLTALTYDSPVEIGAGGTPLLQNRADLRWLDPQLYANLDAATSATINKIREAFQIQRMFERDARGGTRYTELLRSHFGVISPDARLQRPEYLGGGSSRINVNPVAVTTKNQDPAIAYAGDLGAYGTVSANGIGFRKSFTEHSIIIGMVSVRADLSYQQSLEKQWTRKTRFDFYWPSLANLGEQPVYNREIYFQNLPADSDVFGYQERYAEYRYKPSLITGAMRSTYATSLDFWHLAQDFAALPVLDATFIQENPPIDRVVAVSGSLEPQFLLDCWFNLRCTRPMPLYSVPGLIDHF